MTDEILWELAMLEDTEEATSVFILTWAYRVEAQGSQRIALN